MLIVIFGSICIGIWFAGCGFLGSYLGGALANKFYGIK